MNESGPMHTEQITYVPLPIEVLNRLANDEGTMVDSEILRSAISSTRDRYKQADDESQEFLSDEFLSEEDFSVFSRKLIDLAEENFPEHRVMLTATKPKEPDQPLGGAVCTGAANGYSEGGPLLMMLDLVMTTRGLSGTTSETAEEGDLATVFEALENIAAVLMDLLDENAAKDD